MKMLGAMEKQFKREQNQEFEVYQICKACLTISGNQSNSFLSFAPEALKQY